ncbi:hypothetical protein BH11ACT8_BH11ACT8_33520 [soil metagenome]
MTGRLVGALLVLLLLGAGAGYAVAEARTSDTPPPGPVGFASPAPVPAADPSYPVNEYDVQPDPSTAPLATGLPLHEESFRGGGFRLQAQAPDGWRRVSLAGNTSWQFTVQTNPANTYLLRIGLLAGNRQDVTVASNARVFALQQLELDGNAQNLVIQDQYVTDDHSEAGFTATFIDVGGYRRVAVERFLALPGQTSAYYTVAVSGREVDRDGITDLIGRIVATAHP